MGYGQGSVNAINFQEATDLFKLYQIQRLSRICPEQSIVQKKEEHVSFQFDEVFTPNYRLQVPHLRLH